MQLESPGVREVAGLGKRREQKRNGERDKQGRKRRRRETERPAC